MSIEKNVQVVKDFFAAIGSGDKQRLLSLVTEDIEWIIPGEDWPLAWCWVGRADNHLSGRLSDDRRWPPGSAQRPSRDSRLQWTKVNECICDLARTILLGDFALPTTVVES